MVFCYDDALVIQNLPVVIVLFSAQILEFRAIFLVFFYVIVGDVPVGEKVLDFEGVQFFFGFDYLHRPDFTLFCDQSGRHSFFEDTDLWDHKLDFSGQFVHKVELVKEFSVIFLFFTLEVLGLQVSYRYFLDDCVFFDHYFLAKIAPATFIVELMHNLATRHSNTIGVVLVDNVFQLHMSVK